MTCDEARKYFADHWRGVLAGDAALGYHAHVQSCGACRLEADELGRLWETLGTIPQVDPGPGLRGSFYAELREQRRREHERREPNWWMRKPAFQLAFSLAILTAGIFLGRLTQRQNDGQLAELKGEMNGMRQLVTLSLMQQQSAGDRLKGVNWSYRVEPTDTEVLTALVSTLNHDANVNVRLAAVDALRNFDRNPLARRGLVQSLPHQTSPMVQIAILDQCVELKEGSAAPVVAALLRNSELDPSVRQRAGWALKQLQ